MTTKPQTKSNAKRSAEAAIRRTGIEHVIQETDAGWLVVAVMPLAIEPDAAPQSLEDFTREVVGFLETGRCRAAVITAVDAQPMIDDGHANERPAAVVAGDILTRLAEIEVEADADCPMLATTAETETVGQLATALADDTTPAASQAQMPNAASLTAPNRAARQDTLRRTVQALLDAWDDPANREHDIIGTLDRHFSAIRAALGVPTPTASVSLAHHKDTKQAQALALLRRKEGASGPAIAAAMGWAPHTVRGFLAGLTKKGISVVVLERVRQVGPNKTGAKGSYTVYRIAE